MKLHTLLKNLRERQRLRVDDVAAMLDCSRSAVYAWESGGKGPAPEHLRALADAYNCTKKDRADLARLSAFGTDEEPDSADVEPPGPTREASLALAFREAREQSSKLREENAALRAELAQSTTKERAAVVAWLRDCALDPETTGAEMRLFQNQALTIERGEHRREEKE
jgi:transcriptional regulator with XRE-family HTH domain